MNRVKGMGWAGVVYPLAVLFAWPFVGLVRTSMRGGNTYWSVVSESGFWRAMGNSLMLAGLQSVGAAMLASMAGFALAVYPFRGRGAYMAALLGLSALPPQLLLPGGYELIVRLGLFDSFAAVLVPGLLSVISVLLYRTAFERVSHSLIEAARLDGCSEWGIYWKVAMPLVLPTTSVAVLLGFVGSYNTVVWPAVTLPSEHLHTLPVRLAAESGIALTRAAQAKVMAATVLGLVPVILLFGLLQREFLPRLGGSGK